VQISGKIGEVWKNEGILLVGEELKVEVDVMLRWEIERWEKLKFDDKNGWKKVGGF
jgi:hypothetical protein